MYFKDAESTEKPSGLSYLTLGNGKALVMIRRNIRSESRKNENGSMQTIYVYDEVQLETVERRSAIEAVQDDLFRMYSGSTPSLEERVEALESALAEIGGMI